MSVYSIAEIKERVIPIAENYGVKRVVLFGSYARGEATENSDVDFRIDEGKIHDLFALSDFRLDLEDILCKKVDVVTSVGLRDKFLTSIKDDEVVLYG